ncbi:glycosyltransferase family 8 protein [Paenibacillus xylanexedens]|uniref:glycosyltransferase family 8 protein n=1 Tax=Paenibacillus xylanexedens TaxID=528191 RepID=UPI003CFEDD94
MIIVSAANSLYLTHLHVMLKSLLVNLSNTQTVRVVILHTDFTSGDKNKLKYLVECFNSCIDFIKMEDDEIDHIKLNDHLDYISKETFYRIEIPNLLPDAGKVIYIDCDIIILDDLWKIWNIDIDDFYLAAVADFDKKRSIELNISTCSNYFNAGFLLMNLNKWREGHITEGLKELLLSRNDLKYMDQDALNLLLHNHYYELDIRWNYQTYIWRETSIPHPAVLHFTGPDKPWNAETPYNHFYNHYLTLQVDKIE